MFQLSHMGFSNYTVTFSGASGELTLDPKTASATAEWPNSARRFYNQRAGSVSVCIKRINRLWEGLS